MNVKISVLSTALVLISTLLSVAQKPAETLEEYQKNYEWRIRQERLYDVYIPKNLDDAFAQLNKLIEEEDRAKFVTLTEEEAYEKLYFSFVRWITHNWGFYGGSRLSHYIKSLGITHPDDMARFVIVTYHRKLRNEPLNIKEIAESIKKVRQEEWEERIEQGTILYEETRKVAPGEEPIKN